MWPAILPVLPGNKRHQYIGNKNMEWSGIIVGLGNPGNQYAKTRHNMGFEAVNALLAELERCGERPEPLAGAKYRSLLWRGRMPGSQGLWLFVQPQTFMNLSGEAVQPLMAWHKLEPSQLLVVHDELDLEPGRLKLKTGGGNAGHNGLKSISGRLGTQEYHRLRLGVGRPPRDESHSGDVTSWVLSRFSPLEKPHIDSMMPDAVEAMLRFAVEGPERAANTVNTKKKPA